ncbi:MAG: tetratricopeptide repeat protein, partial [Bacteroidota bacterium]
MKKVTTTCLFIFYLFSLNAQEPDSVLGAQKFDEGMALYKSKKYNQAIKLFTEATTYFGEEYVAGHAKSLVWIGYGHLRLSNEKKMIDFFKKAEPYARATVEKYNDYQPIINNQLMLAMMLRSHDEGKEALVYYQSLEDLILESEPNPMYMSLIYQHRAQIAQKNRDLKAVPGLLEKAIEFGEQSGNRRQIIEVLETGQVYFYELGNFEKARQLSDELIRLATLEYGADGSDLARYFTERARLDFIRQEHEMAMNWVDRAIEVGTNATGHYWNDFGYSYYIKANLLLNGKSYTEAIKYFDAALEEYNDLPIHQNLIVAALDGKLWCQSYLKDVEGIASTINQLESQLLKANSEKLTEANALLAVAYGYSSLEDYDKSTTYLDRVIEMVDADDKGTSAPLYVALFQYSEMELERGNTQEALLLIDKAIAANTRKVGDDTYFISPQSSAELYVHKTQILLAENKKEEALAVLEKGFNRIQTDRATLVGSEFSMESIHQLRNSALEISYQLYDETKDLKYLETAFRVGELTKSQQLIQWISESLNSKSGTLDSSLFAQRRILVNNISTLERLIVKEDSTMLAKQYTDSLFSLRRSLYDVSLLIKNNHPEFYSITYEKMNADLQSSLRNLDENEQLLSYFLTESDAYLLVLGSETDFVKIKRDGLEGDIETFRTMLSNPSENELSGISQKLYERILPNDRLELADRVTIVTDGMLAYLPFELLTNKDRFLMEN